MTLRSSLGRGYRRVLLVTVALGVGVVGSAYLVLVLSTANAPPSAGLSTPPSLGQTRQPGGPTPVSDQGADGPWVVAAGDLGGFVGYRAREILAFDFVQSPNEAVGRTTDVHGSLSIRAATLESAVVSADVASIRSDLDIRDGHLREFLHLDGHSDAGFKLTAPVEIGQPTAGRVVDVQAHGDLTILDSNRPVVFPLQARWNGDSIQLAGQLVVRRSDFNMDIPQLLGFRVSEEITIELQLLFVRPCPDPCASQPGGSPSPAPSASPSPTSSPTSSPTTYPPAATAAGRLPAGWGEIAFLGVTQPAGQDDPIGDIYVINGGRGSPSQLTKTLGTLEDDPAWSGDGQRVAYARYPINLPPELWVMNADGSNQHAVGVGLELRSLSWSSDGHQVVGIPADDQRSSLVIVDIDTGRSRTLLDDPGTERDPDWSPDRDQIVFSLLPKGGTDSDLYLVSADGSGLRRLTDDPGFEYSPAWSPDGGHIAFIREGDLWIIDSDGSQPRRLTSAIRADSATWSPDGRRIAFVIAGARPLEADEARRSIWIVNADGSHPLRLTFDFDLVAHPTWRPHR